MNRVRSVSLILGVGLLAACTVENCGDPSEDGLATALGCTISPSGYQAQTDALAAQLSQRQTLAATLRAENVRLNRQLASLNASQRQVASQLVRVNDQIASLDDQLNTQLQQQQISQAEYNLAQSQLSDLNQRRGGVNVEDPADAAEVARLEREIADLRSLF